MKKSLTRVLSLVLVLVMMLGIMPVASAAEPTFNPTMAGPSGTVAVDTSFTVRVTANTPAGYTVKEINWTTPSGFSRTDSNLKGETATGSAAQDGEYKFQATVVYENTETHETVAKSCPQVTVRVVKPVASVALDRETLDVTVGATASLTATVKPSDATNRDVTWTSSNGAVATVSSTGVVTGVSAGTATITAKSASDATKLDTCEVTVDWAPVTSVTISTNTTELRENSESAVVVDVNPDSADPDVNWHSSNTSLLSISENGVIRVGTLAAGKTSEKVTIYAVSVGKDASNQTVKSNDLEITVSKNPYSLTLSANPTTIAVNGKSTLSLSAKNGTTDIAKENITLSISDETVISINDAKTEITGLKAGEATITALVGDSTKEGDYAEKSIKITVSNASGTIIENNYETVATAAKSHKLTPEFDSNGDGTADTLISGIEYSYERKAGNATVAQDGTVSVTSTGWAQVTITAKKDGATLATKDVYVSFYNLNKIEVTMDEGATELDFGDKNDIDKNSALYTLMLSSMDNTSTDWVHFTTTDPLGRIGKLSGMYMDIYDYQQVSSLNDVKFNVTGGAGGVWKFDYQIKKGRSTTDVTVGAGSVIINFDGKPGSIEYYTSSGTKLTFKESDFYKYWDDADMDSSLKYVKFDLDDTTPKYGKLYTSTTLVTAAYKAYASHKFAYGTYTGSDYKDLGSLTYVPSTTKVTAHSESIPFVAYGTDSDDTLVGSVTIYVNQTSDSITSRGIFFGSEYKTGETYADLIAEKYKDATKQELGYVVFELPSAQNGTLFSAVPSSGGYSKVAQGTMLSSGTKLYYGQKSGEKRMQNAAFIPAAGKSGQITLSYTAYDISGENPDTDVLILTVKTKSASAVFSDVNAKNYSWASDSVDFLYYEGTAQGSNGKYNPSANITRRDFMLMLYRAFLAEDYGTFTVTSNFPDVVKGADSYSKEIYQAVGVAKYLGIAQGTNNKFNPTSNITRQEAMVLIYRTLETINKDLRTDSGVKLTSMKDYSKISSWATTAISNLVGHGVIKGNNDNIKPLDPISRAEMAAILHRVITY